MGDSEEVVPYAVTSPPSSGEENGVLAAGFYEVEKHWGVVLPGANHVSLAHGWWCDSPALKNIKQ